jgi:hypothetical protein
MNLYKLFVIILAINNLYGMNLHMQNNAARCNPTVLGTHAVVSSQHNSIMPVPVQGMVSVYNQVPQINRIPTRAASLSQRSRLLQQITKQTTTKTNKKKVLVITPDPVTGQTRAHIEERIVRRVDTQVQAQAVLIQQTTSSNNTLT